MPSARHASRCDANGGNADEGLPAASSGRGSGAGRLRPRIARPENSASKASILRTPVTRVNSNVTPAVYRHLIADTVTKAPRRDGPRPGRRENRLNTVSGSQDWLPA